MTVDELEAHLRRDPREPEVRDAQWLAARGITLHARHLVALDHWADTYSRTREQVLEAVADTFIGEYDRVREVGLRISSGFAAGFIVIANGRSSWSVPKTPEAVLEWMTDNVQELDRQ